MQYSNNVILLRAPFPLATCFEPSQAKAKTRYPSWVIWRQRMALLPPLTPSPTLPTYADVKLAQILVPYLLSATQMWTMGYPIEIQPPTRKAVYYINSPRRPTRLTYFGKLDVNAPEFVPGKSGRGSDVSLPRFEAEETNIVERLCVRCQKQFQMTREGRYLAHESCIYHWGRMGTGSAYSCCRSPRGSNGCVSVRFHVWSGTVPGMNGPLDGYVQAKTLRGGVYAVDAEMVFTTAGLELASIVFIEPNGHLVYKSLVRPSCQLLDCNTRFSGITTYDLARATKTLSDVQKDILKFVGSDTILVGHALENDLRALKLIHGSVIDTTAMYPHPRGFPMRRGLKALSEKHLGRTIQNINIGHSPLEDAHAAMDLVIHKLRSDFYKHTHCQSPILDYIQPAIIKR